MAEPEVSHDQILPGTASPSSGFSIEGCISNHQGGRQGWPLATRVIFGHQNIVSEIICFAFTFHCCLDVQFFPDLQYGMMFVYTRDIESYH